MTTYDIEKITLQLAVLHELRNPQSYGYSASTRQLFKLRLAFQDMVGEAYRIPVIRALCGYDSAFTSTRQLLQSDARGLIDWLWSPEDDPKSKPTKELSVLVCKFLMHVAKEAEDDAPLST